MARSYKGPWVCDRNPWAKRYANRRLRRRQVTEESLDGGMYKKYSNPWDICDWRWRVSALVDHQARDEHTFVTARWPVNRIRLELWRTKQAREYKLRYGNARAKRPRLK
ncbi:MAG: hypothetical protein E6R04_10215 [Spirochaetes bacterium]|nr:MAG: hypothetical protein E6R04_10215 [Spirochaetota bacterium]